MAIPYNSFDAYSAQDYSYDRHFGSTYEAANAEKIAYNLTRALSDIGIKVTRFQCQADDRSYSYNINIDLQVVDFNQLQLLEQVIADSNEYRNLLMKNLNEAKKRDENPTLKAAYEKYQMLLSFYE